MPKLHNEFARIVLKSIENGKFLSLALNISKNVWERQPIRQPDID